MMRDPTNLENEGLREWALAMSDTSGNVYFEFVADMLIRVRDMAVESVRLSPESKLSLGEIQEVAKQLDSDTGTECSVCRRVHGPEVRHASE